MNSVEPKPRSEFPARPRIIFVGTPNFAVPSLKALVNHGLYVEAVVTQPDRPRGRGRQVIASPVKQAATEYGIEVLQPERASDTRFCEVIRSKNPDLLVVVAFGQILKGRLLKIPPLGALNIHASLLPKYRGAAPIHWAILNNEATTGLTAMRMDEGMDTGPVLLQEEVPILANETAGHLHDRLALLSGVFLIRTIDGLIENRLEERPQDEIDATYTGKLDRKMSMVRWHQPAGVLSGLIRALDPWPGAFTTYQGKEIKLFSSQVVDGEGPEGVPGRVLGHSEGSLVVETGKGIIKVGELQIAGKKRLAATDFLRGFHLDKGVTLGK